MKKQIKWTIAKSAFWAVLIGVISKIVNSVEPLIKNDVAMSQMQSNDQSFYLYQMYQQFTPYVIALVVIVVAVSFHKEIKYLINFIRSKYI